MSTPDCIHVLDRPSVMRCLDEIDPVALVVDTLRAHAFGQTVLPAEGYLAWENSEGAYSRSLAMLGGVTGGIAPLYGLKVVNAATSNPSRGLERAGGLLMLFDPETARPVFLAEAALISAVRTAAYTMASMRHLAPERFDEVSVLGCGALARMHLRLLERYFPDVIRVHAFDIVPSRLTDFVAWAEAELTSVTVTAATDSRSCVEASRVVLTTTVSDNPYISPEWIPEPTFFAHVSLDDVCAEVFDQAEVFVDDVGLVVDNPRRILGAMIAAGRIASAPSPDCRPAIRGTLGHVLTGKLDPVRPISRNVVSNPFGMAILDIALGSAVREVARANKFGFTVDLVEGVRGEC